MLLQDSVDGAPARQLNLTLTELQQLIGATAVEALRELPHCFDRSRRAAVAPPPPSQQQQLQSEDENKHEGEWRQQKQQEEVVEEEEVEIFIRRYSSDERPWIPMHCDSARLTCNVALVPDTAFRYPKLWWPFALDKCSICLTSSCYLVVSP